ncbi:unnamed protein product [Adineta ricciae]|uniref:Uncharacterized protein n=1 Tax=Adineta ricciae TaxID=249248 RepID=A0A815PJN8_ADIRI|nr:unnamed protein product [Adineta ricciae]
MNLERVQNVEQICLCSYSLGETWMISTIVIVVVNFVVDYRLLFLRQWYISYSPFATIKYNCVAFTRKSLDGSSMLFLFLRISSADSEDSSIGRCNLLIA